MASLERIDWEILNATADDWESLDDIISLLHGAFENATVSVPDVEHRLTRLTDVDLLEARQENGQSKPRELPANLAWYRMTDSGREAWQESDFASQLK